MKKKIDLFTLISFLFCISFYMFFAVFDGAVICADTPSYINMHSSREPLYPILLATFRWLFQGFSNNFYLNMIAVLQSFLMAISVFSMEEYMRKKFQVPQWSAMLILLMPLAVSLLCRFAAKRGSMYSNSILTEGIAIPLYLFFFRFLMEYLLDNTKKSFQWCIFLMFLMVSTRKQMIFAFVMLMGVILYVAYKKKKIKSGILTFIISIVLIFGTNAILDVGYNFVVRGEKVTHSGDIRFVATIAFYTAEREDANLIDDENVRELFLDIYDACNEQGYLGHSADQGWSGRVSHFGDCYDRIQIDTMWSKINSYVQLYYRCNQEQVGIYEDEIMEEISKVIIPLHIGRVIQVFWDNFLSGLVVTVARHHPILIYYSLVIYILYLIMLYLVYRKKNKRIFLFSVMVLLSIISNVGLVSLVIFCQTRYTIYNMALFYIALVVMTSVLVKKESQNIESEKMKVN